ncbi:MAG: von Willebrand factor type A domain-containing protein [Gemmatimonadota bacterium]|nr:von Willebrand factor type A domain-containing protein [Gemmatimonadota bacterium]
MYVVNAGARYRRRLSLLLVAALVSPTLAARAPDAPRRAAVTVVTGWITDVNGTPLDHATVSVAERGLRTNSGADGRFTLRVPRQGESESVLIGVARIGYERRDLRVALHGDSVTLNVPLVQAQTRLEQTVVAAKVDAAPQPVGESVRTEHDAITRRRSAQVRKDVPAPYPAGAVGTVNAYPEHRTPRDPAWHLRRAPADSGNTEAYDHIDENSFRSPLVAPLSTFSVDVDRASYTNVRRYLNGGYLPPRDAVRIEELVNYFPYGDPAPGDEEAPIRITTEIAPAPWNGTHDLVRIGLRARDVDMRRAPPSNLVFLVDVSGSMMGPGRLPLVKQSLAMLVGQLREEDRVALVVYAGRAGLVLPSTSDKQRILAALEGLEAGGSTAGGAGIKLAYDVARENFIRHGNNRVILCTDGDFNVGQSNDGELVNLIEDRRKEGAYLTILGFGMGNYKDAKMEKLAGAGNGNYGYIDDLLEARKMLVKEMGGTLLTVAKDVKLQVEFDPTRVQAYRLLGYEDRLLRDEDFANDAKDAGDVGAGHSVTALYEIVRSDVRLDVKLPEVAPLRYQRQTVRGAAPANELLHVAMRYKAPDGEESRLVTHPVRANRTIGGTPSESMRFASAVAGFGMLLRQSPNAGTLTWPQVVSLASGARGADPEGYRADFIRLAELAQSLSRRTIAEVPDRPR